MRVRLQSRIIVGKCFHKLIEFKIDKATRIECLCVVQLECQSLIAVREREVQVFANDCTYPATAAVSIGVVPRNLRYFVGVLQGFVVFSHHLKSFDTRIVLPFSRVLAVINFRDSSIRIL